MRVKKVAGARVAWGAAIAFVFVSTSVLGLGSSAAVADAPTHTISGVVKDAEGDTQTFADVHLFGDDSTTPIAYSGTDSGTFSFSGLADGTYRVETTENGFHADWYDDASDYATATPITISGADVGNLTLTLTPITYTVQGTVAGGSPAIPLAGRTVVLYKDADTDDPYLTTETDNTGHYAFTNLPSDNALALEYVGGDGWAEEWWQNQYSAEYATQFDDSVSPTPTYDVTLARVGTVSGRVTQYGSTKALKNADVQVQTVQGFYVGDAMTNSRGDYTLTGIPSGQYKVQAFGPDYGDLGVQSKWDATWYGNALRLGAATIVTIPADSGKTGVNIGVHLDTKITGRITDAHTHKSIYSGVVDLTTTSGKIVETTGIADGGRYEFDTVAAGSYKVRVQANQTTTLGEDVNAWYGGNGEAHAKVIHLAVGHPHSGVNVALHRGGSVTGTLSQGLDAEPVVKAELLTLGGSLIDSEYVDDVGHEYGFHANPGTYVIRFVTSDGYYASQYYPAGSLRLYATRITIRTDKTKVLKPISLDRVTPGTITGRVTTSDGSSVSGLTVTANRATTLYYGEATPDPVQVHADGTFTIPNVPAGTYTIDYDSNSVGPSAYHDRYGNGDVITVRSGHTTTLLTQTVTHDVTVTGTVTDTDAAPADEATVQFYTLAGTPAQQAYVADGDDGKYSVQLPAGQYRVRFVEGRDQTLGGTWLGGGQDFATSQTLDTSSTTVADGTLVAGSSVVGRALDEKTHKPVDNLNVVLFRLEPDGSWYQATGGDGSTDGEGNFTVTGLATGTYVAEFTDLPPDTFPIGYRPSYDGKSTTIAGATRFVVGTVGGTTTVPTAYIYRAN